MAVVGAIAGAGAVVVLARRQLTPAGQLDWTSVGLTLLAGLLLWRFKKLPEPYLIGGAALLGVLLEMVPSFGH